MARKLGLATQEHLELGAVLFEMRNQALDRLVQVANAYPQSAPQTRHLRKALAALDSARAALDGALGWEHPNEFDPFIYYPAGRRVDVTAREPEGGGSAQVPAQPE